MELLIHKRPLKPSLNFILLFLEFKVNRSAKFLSKRIGFLLMSIDLSLSPKITTSTGCRPNPQRWVFLKSPGPFLAANPSIISLTIKHPVVSSISRSISRIFRISKIYMEKKLIPFRDSITYKIGILVYIAVSEFIKARVGMTSYILTRSTIINDFIP